MDMITAQGMRMPKLGFGTFRMKGADCTQAVESALAIGYRHIDTAEMYDNEEAIGAAIARSNVPRADLHLTSKVWHDHLAPEAMARSLDATLAKLGVDCVDLYLVHWPAAGMDMAGVMHSLMRLRESGKARAVGVANFPSKLVREAVAQGAALACNQVEYHALLSQDTLLEAMRPAGIALVAYAPLAQGRLTGQEALQDIAAKHSATAAQVALKWLLDQDGVGAIPKASRRESQQANMDALRITLDDADRAAIAALPKDSRFVSPAFAPAWDAAA